MGGGEDHGVDARVGRRPLEIVTQREAVSLRQGQRRVDLLAHAVHEAQPGALPLDRVDQVLASPTEADDRGINH
jgi:hypothetical protein